LTVDASSRKNYQAPAGPFPTSGAAVKSLTADFVCGIINSTTRVPRSEVRIHYWVVKTEHRQSSFDCGTSGRAREMGFIWGIGCGCLVPRVGVCLPRPHQGLRVASEREVGHGAPRHRSARRSGPAGLPSVHLRRHGCASPEPQLPWRLVVLPRRRRVRRVKPERAPCGLRHARKGK